jgi:hypothetical protein
MPTSGLKQREETTVGVEPTHTGLCGPTSPDVPGARGALRASDGQEKKPCEEHGSHHGRERRPEASQNIRVPQSM